MRILFCGVIKMDNELLLEAVEEKFGIDAEIVRTYSEYNHQYVDLRVRGMEYEQTYRVRDMGGWFMLEYRP